MVSHYSKIERFDLIEALECQRIVFLVIETPGRCMFDVFGNPMG